MSKVCNYTDEPDVDQYSPGNYRIVCAVNLTDVLGDEKMKKLCIATSLAAGLVSLSTQCLAYEAGDWIIRGGVASAQPDESSSNTSIGGSAVADTGLGVDNDTQIGLTFTYMVTDRIGIELLASTPFEHEVTMSGSGLDPLVPAGTKLATVEHLPPTLSAQYFFLDPQSAWQPYAGIGINYWLVLDEDLSGDAEGALGARSLEVDDSIGLSMQLGVDYRIDDHWLVNAAVWRIDIETEASFYSDVAAAKVKADIDVDPWVYMLSVGYRF